jgi:hypothetical protein
MATSFIHESSFVTPKRTRQGTASRQVRAARGRQPYVIHRPDGEGGFTSSADPTSVALKERFSHDDAG